MANTEATSKLSLRKRYPALPYFYAFLSVALALWARLLMTPSLGAQFPFVTVFFAVTLTAWCGGLFPALFASLLGYLGVAYYLLPPVHNFALRNRADVIGAGFYLFISLTTALFSEAQHKAQARAEASAQEARRQEAAARQSEARKSAIQDTALDAILLLNHEGRIVEFNPAAETMFGLSQAEARNCEMAERLLPPVLRDEYRSGMARYLAGGEWPALGQRLESRALRADGTEFPIELAVTRIPGEGPPLFSVSIHDITARKQSERHQRFLVEASHLLAASLDHATTLQNVAQLVVPHLADWCVIHLLDAEGELELVTATHVDPSRVEAAREASRRYPPRRDAARGLWAVIRSGQSEWIETITDAMIRTAAQDEAHYRLLLESGMKSFLCVPLVSRDRILGTLTFVGAESGHRYSAESLPLAEELARRAALAVDNSRLYAAAQKEIAERQQAERALKESRDYYRSLTEAVPQLVWTTRPDGIPDYFNQHWLDYTGQNAATGDDWWRGGVHPEDLPRTMERWNAALRTGGLYEVEYRLKGADGTYRWFLVRGVPLRNDHGEIIKWFGTCTDIDQQKRSERSQRFLADMGEQIRGLADPAAILGAVVQALGKHLQVTHATYADIDTSKNQYTGHRDYSVDGRTFAGAFPLDRFGAELVEALKSGNTVVVNDAQTDPLLGHHYETLYRPSNIRAFICVPLIKAARWIAVLSVTMHGEARCWTDDEIGLLEKVMEQTWLAVENVRLYQAERDRSEQLTLAIQEVHHRVKNNLQAVSALLEMQIDPDTAVLPVEAVYDSLSQIKTIALVHDLLSRDKPIGKVDVAQVLTNLARLLAPSMGRGDRPLPIRVTAESVWMPTKAATSLALAVNELLTNAAKHNTTSETDEESRHDAIEVSLWREEETVHVAVQDHGPGFPPQFDPVLDANIGLQLVHTLVQHDLRGAVTFTNRDDANRNEANSHEANNYEASGGEADRKEASRHDADNNRACGNDRDGASGTRGGRVEIVFADRSLPE